MNDKLKELDPITQQTIEEFKNLSEEELYKLNAKLILNETNKIPIEHDISIYVDLDMIFDIKLGRYLYSIYKYGSTCSIEHIKDIINNIYRNKYILDYSELDEALSNNVDNEYSEFEFICSPFTTGLSVLLRLINNVEPINLINEFKVKDYIHLVVNVYPYKFNKDLLITIKNILHQHVPAKTITLINQSYPNHFTEENIKKYRIMIINEFRKMLNKTPINNIINVLKDDSFDFILSDHILVANSRNIIPSEIIKDKYKEDYSIVDKEIEMLISYMNLFLHFGLIHIVPLITKVGT